MNGSSHDLNGIFCAALAAVDPAHAVGKAIRVENDVLYAADGVYPLAAYRRILVVGAGKASARMAQAVETLLGPRIEAGLVITKYAHGAPLERIELLEAAHPVPDEAGVAATRRILDLLAGSDEQTLVLCLLSGGASALLVVPAEGLTLADKQETTALLLRCGANIGELNAVRKHLSAVKGGRLAQAAFPTQLLTLIVSDVIGDPLDVIASGPTAPDGASFADAWAVIEKYQLAEKLPERVARHLQRGVAGLVGETVKDCDPSMRTTRNLIVASNAQALQAARCEAERLGCPTILVSTALHGEARNAASWLAGLARAVQLGLREGQRCCLLCGGETTVTVNGEGKGGRNQELALAFAMEIAGLSGIALLSAGTDGNDGPTDAAGAWVDGNTVELAQRHAIDPTAYLATNDAWHFFARLDAASGSKHHLRTGPTGTNVMDVQVVLVEGQPAS